MRKHIKDLSRGTKFRVAGTTYKFHYSFIAGQEKRFVLENVRTGTTFESGISPNMVVEVVS